MSDVASHFSQNYICPKCHGRQPDVREVALSKARILDVIPSKDNRYIEVTCMLCGYTEFYNRAVYLNNRAPAREPGAEPLPNEADGV
jgi:predicted nucleic-acid-binding Zn-ribbon protein